MHKRYKFVRCDNLKEIAEKVFKDVQCPLRLHPTQIYKGLVNSYSLIDNGCAVHIEIHETLWNNTFDSIIGPISKGDREGLSKSLKTVQDLRKKFFETYKY